LPPHPWFASPASVGGGAATVAIGPGLSPRALTGNTKSRASAGTTVCGMPGPDASACVEAMVGRVNGEVTAGVDLSDLAESEVRPSIPMAAIAMALAVRVAANLWAPSAGPAKAEADLPSFAACAVA
jgi:hypothetical protein